MGAAVGSLTRIRFRVCLLLFGFRFAGILQLGFLAPLPLGLPHTFPQHPAGVRSLPNLDETLLLDGHIGLDQPLLFDLDAPSIHRIGRHLLDLQSDDVEVVTVFFVPPHEYLPVRRVNDRCGPLEFLPTKIPVEVEHGELQLVSAVDLLVLGLRATTRKPDGKDGQAPDEQDAIESLEYRRCHGVRA